jgi:diguanylate cyclase (GGDEF)-like protein
MGLIIACTVWLEYPRDPADLLSLPYGTMLLARISPLLLVAYITTMLSADIRRAYGHVKRQAETDELTGVLNMRAFSAMAERVSHQAERYARPYSLLMIDSDSLKEVNDAHGHESGNRLLRQIVECIQSQLRQTDVVARYGGDEFVVLLPETPCSGAVGVAERIRRKVETTALATREKGLTATVSIGVACYPTHGVDFEAVLEKADQGMYASKSGGKNRVTLFSA